MRVGYPHFEGRAGQRQKTSTLTLTFDGVEQERTAREKEEGEGRRKGRVGKGANHATSLRKYQNPKSVEAIIPLSSSCHL